MIKIKQPTTTSLVLEALRANPNEFFSLQMLASITGRKPTDVSAALHHLRNHGAADVVVQQGHGWWFADARDTRQRVLAEIKPDIKKPGRRKGMKASK